MLVMTNGIKATLEKRLRILDPWTTHFCLEVNVDLDEPGFDSLWLKTDSIILYCFYTDTNLV